MLPRDDRSLGQTILTSFRRWESRCRTTGEGLDLPSSLMLLPARPGGSIGTRRYSLSDVARIGLRREMKGWGTI